MVYGPAKSATWPHYKSNTKKIQKGIEWTDTRSFGSSYFIKDHGAWSTKMCQAYSHQRIIQPNNSDFMGLI